jgi:ribose transport system ATP-binding protein
MNDRVPAVVSMKGISKSFGGVRALHDVSLEVEQGEVHALQWCRQVHHSQGAELVHRPDSGTITVGGKLLAKVTAESARAAGSAMNFQEPSLIPT